MSPNKVIGDATLVASRVVSSAPVKLVGIYGVNNNASQQYIQIHEAGSLPANGATPRISLPMAAGQFYCYEFSDGMDLDSVTICNSSTLATKTLGVADCSIVAIVEK